MDEHIQLNFESATGEAMFTKVKLLDELQQKNIRKWDQWISYYAEGINATSMRSHLERERREREPAPIRITPANKYLVDAASKFRDLIN